MDVLDIDNCNTYYCLLFLNPPLGDHISNEIFKGVMDIDDIYHFNRSDQVLLLAKISSVPVAELLRYANLLYDNPINLMTRRIKFSDPIEGYSLKKIRLQIISSIEKFTKDFKIVSTGAAAKFLASMNKNLSIFIKDNMLYLTYSDHLKAQVDQPVTVAMASSLFDEFNTALSMCPIELTKQGSIVKINAEVDLWIPPIMLLELCTENDINNGDNISLQKKLDDVYVSNIEDEWLTFELKEEFSRPGDTFKDKYEIVYVSGVYDTLERWGGIEKQHRRIYYVVKAKTQHFPHEIVSETSKSTLKCLLIKQVPEHPDREKSPELTRRFIYGERVCATYGIK